MTRLARLVLLVGLTLLVASAARPDSLTRFAADGLERFRAMDALARDVLANAVRLSPTVARIVGALQQSDLIVHVQTGMLPLGVNGITAVIAAGPAARYVRLVLKIPNAMPDLIAVLGHELQHVIEIATTPWIQDGCSLAAHSRQIGWPTSRDGYFETRAAMETGSRVRWEVALATRTGSGWR